MLSTKIKWCQQNWHHFYENNPRPNQQICDSQVTDCQPWLTRRVEGSVRKWKKRGNSNQQIEKDLLQGRQQQKKTTTTTLNKPFDYFTRKSWSQTSKIGRPSFIWNCHKQQQSKLRVVFQDRGGIIVGWWVNLAYMPQVCPFEGRDIGLHVFWRIGWVPGAHPCDKVGPRRQCEQIALDARRF